MLTTPAGTSLVSSTWVRSVGSLPAGCAEVAFIAELGYADRAAAGRLA
jgi:hypothetical protein